MTRTYYLDSDLHDVAWHETQLTVTLRDTVTGATATHHHPASLYWWAEGNGSCDCNRSRPFLSEDEWDAKECNPGLRYVVVDFTPDVPGMEKDEALRWMNER